MENTTAARTSDNLKTLAKRHGLTVAGIRAAAKDIDLTVAYSADRRTWVIDEPASKVRAFNEHLATILG